MDDGLLSGLVGFGNGFLKGQSDAEDRKYKRLEWEAKSKSTQSEEQRKRFNDILDIRSKGLIPPTLEPGQQYSDTDPGKYEWDPNSPSMLQAKKQPQSMLFGPDRLNIQRDNQTSAAVDKVVNDPQMKNHVQRVQGANRIKSQLEAIKRGEIKDTSQFLNDLNTEYVNLLTGSNNAALGKLERTEYRTYAGDLANVMQKISASPQSINSPEILHQLEKSVDDLKKTYQKNIVDRGASLQRTYKHNPDATTAQQEKIREMIGQFATEESGQPGLINPGAGAHPQDSEALQWAKGHPKDPRAQAILKANGL